MRATPILAEDYLRKEMNKSNRPHKGDRFNELINHFAMLNQHEHLRNVETEGKTYHRRQYNNHCTQTQINQEEMNQSSQRKKQ